MDCQGQEDSQSGGIAADTFCFTLLTHLLSIIYIVNRVIIFSPVQSDVNQEIRLKSCKNRVIIITTK